MEGSVEPHEEPQSVGLFPHSAPLTYQLLAAAPFVPVANSVHPPYDEARQPEPQPLENDSVQIICEWYINEKKKDKRKNTIHFSKINK
jgi:hypothetical protein